MRNSEAYEDKALSADHYYLLRFPSFPSPSRCLKMCLTRLILVAQNTGSILQVSQLSDFALEQHRVYLLRDFQHLPDGSIVCSGFPRLKPDKVIAARFPNASILTSWQDHRDRSKLPWPLELVSFRAVRLSPKRFRFTLNCIDFHQEWESDWPQLMQAPNAPLQT